MNALPQDKRLSAMTMLFGKEFGDDAAKLANNLPELQRQLKLTAGNDALGSMQKESDINKDSLSAQWLLVKTGAQNTFSSLGETLRQPLMDILYTVKSVTGALRRWVEANPELTGTLMKVVAVVAAVTVGLGTLAVALAAVLGPLAVIRLGFSVLGIKTLPSVTWWVRMKTCWYLIALMPTGATPNERRKCSGNACNAALRHFRYNWQKGGQISTRKCL